MTPQRVEQGFFFGIIYTLKQLFCGKQGSTL